jgi:uncharacterized membrane protein SpoIIM required for sporulation
MREIRFIDSNAPKWKRFESMLSNSDKTANPNELTDLFIELTDDLSYSKTYYPESKTTLYLNSITAKVHQSIYKNKSESLSRFITFWKVEIPQVMRSVHPQMLLALILFLIFAGIGVISMIEDPRFVRTVLGEGYVNMTEENIKSGNPFGVYQKEDSWSMFFMIAFNNVMVMLRMYVAGVAFSIGTIAMLFYNAVMLGSFHAMFAQHNLLGYSFAVIWIHGTLEISCMIISAGAGLVLGNSLLFPGTYSRSESFRIAAKKGMKIAVGLIPVIIMAAVLESFVTRYSHMPLWLSSLIIGLSTIFIIGYYVVYPIYLERRSLSADDTELATS